MQIETTKTSLGNLLIIGVMFLGLGVVYKEKVLPITETKIALPSGIATVQDRQPYTVDKDLLTTKSLNGDVWVFPVSKDYTTKINERVSVQRFVGKSSKQVNEHLVGDYQYDVKLEYSNGGMQ